MSLGHLHHARSLSFGLAAACAFLLGMTGGPHGAAEDSVDRLAHETLVKAVDAVAPCLVSIETAGGLEREGLVLKGQGPTTGVIVAGDGHIITSSFNFVHQPSSILVTLPSGDRRAAKRIASDFLYMVTLLKLEAANLPVPVASPKQELQVGQTVATLGKALGEEKPSVSVGIVSATGRVWGKAVQTDAKVSPMNYGGPLIDLRGRVVGILVPLSPMQEGETAGYEWYDSGIGFAIPFEDVLAILSRLKKGVDLKRGLMGIIIPGGLYDPNIRVQEVAYRSAAAKAGIAPGDSILEVDGSPVRHQADLRLALARKYAGDRVLLKLRRDQKELSIECDLEEKLPPYERPFLGVLPVRNAPQDGAYVRHVFPGSPAAQAGVQPGDRITKFTDKETKQPQALAQLVWGSQPERKVAIEVLRNQEKLTLEATMGSYLADVPESLSPDKPIAAPEPPPATKPAAPAPSDKSAPAADSKNEPAPAAPAPATPTPPAPTPPAKDPAPTPGNTGDKPPAPPEKPAPAANPQPPAQPDKPGPAAPAPTAEPGKDPAPAPGKAEGPPIPVDVQANPKPAETKPAPPPPPPTGVIRRTLDKINRTYWAYVPPNYDARYAVGLLVWIHPSGASLETEIQEAWKKPCEERNIALLGILAGNIQAWENSDVSAVPAALGDFRKTYKVDPSRIVLQGHLEGADQALRLAMTQRMLFRGVIASAPFRTPQVGETAPGFPLSFLFLSPAKTALPERLAKMKSSLDDARFPVLVREVPPFEQGMFPESAVDFIARWLDSLDRI